MRPAICQHDHVTCGCENIKKNVNSGMDENTDRFQETSARKAFAQAKAKLDKRHKKKHDWPKII